MTNICVFCGSSAGTRPDYKSSAHTLGGILAENDCRLVYGGGKLGLMGIIAQAVLDNSGETVGVIPDFMIPRELAHEGLTKIIVTDSMHSRKAEMARISDGFIVLPGGFGTLDEMAEILTWNQLGIIQKPVVLLNIAGYFDPLLEMFSKMKSEGFLRNTDALHVTTDPVNAMQIIMDFKTSDQGIGDQLDRT